MRRQHWGRSPDGITIATATLLLFVETSSRPVLPEPLVSPSPQPNPSFVLPSTAGIDYRQLQTLLRDRQWREADREPFRIVLELGDRTAEGWLDQASVEALDCTDLHTHRQTILVGHFPYRLGYDYATFGSGFNRTWRLDLNPDCGF